MKSFPFSRAKTAAPTGPAIPAAVPMSEPIQRGKTRLVMSREPLDTPAPYVPTPVSRTAPSPRATAPEFEKPTTSFIPQAGVEVKPIPEGFDTENLDARARIESQIREKFAAKVNTHAGQDDFLIRSERSEGAAFLWPAAGKQSDGLIVLDSRVGFSFRTLSHDTPASASPKVAAACDAEGYTLTEWKPAHGYYIASKPDAAVRRLRDTFARALRVAPWEIELAAIRRNDLETGRPRFERVVITRMPALDLSRDKRVGKLKELAGLIPDWHSDCKVEENIATGHVTMSYSKKLFLPKTVALRDLLPDRPSPDDWASIPLGIGSNSQPVGFDLTQGPHGLAVGPTGTGKTVLLLADVVGRLARGHRIAIIDPTKAGLDFLKIRPYASIWADDLPKAQEAILRIYAEVARRKAVLQELEEVKWSDVDVHARRAHGLFPLTVVIDEYASLVIPEDIPKSLPRDSDYRKEAEERNTAKGILQGTVGRIAREARFAGIHLVLAAQRPDASILGGELRSNLTSSVQLSPPGKPISREALTMVFPGEVGPQAAEVLAALDDGASKGLGVMAAEGGTATGFRVAYAPAAEIPEMLEGLGIPLGSPDDILAELDEEKDAEPEDGESE